MSTLLGSKKALLYIIDDLMKNSISEGVLAYRS